MKNLRRPYWLTLAGVAVVTLAVAADIKISELPSGGTIETTDSIPVARGATTQKVTVGALATKTQASLTADVTGVLPVANGGTNASSASAARTSLGVAIGSDVQAWDADLDIWAGKTAPAGAVVGTSDTQTLTNKSIAGGQITSAVATATALAANGANCSAGSSPLGIDASGAVEGCFTVEVPLTFSTGLTRTTNTITVNTSQNIATLSNLTGNGFVKTSGGTGALSIDSNTYLTTASAASTYQPLDTALTALAGGSDFVVFSGPTTSNKTFTLPNASTTILTTNAAVTVSQGGTGQVSMTGLLQGNGTSAVTGISNSSTVGQILRVTGASTYAWGALDLADSDAITGDIPDANLSANVPLLNSSAAFSSSVQAQTLISSATTPTLRLFESDGGTDQKYFVLDQAAGVLKLRTATDALSTGKDALSITHGTGTALATVSFGNATDNPTYSFLGTGAVTFGGAVSFGGGTGTAGQVLTSNGSSAPTYQTQPYDVAFQADGEPEASAVLLRYVFPRAGNFVDDLVGSKAIAAVAATAEAVLSVKKNGSTVGTITFAAAGSTGTFVTSGGAVSFAADDVITVVAPGTPDATLADLAITLVGTRS